MAVKSDIQFKALTRLKLDPRNPRLGRVSLSPPSASAANGE